jgi:hypothetical protein
MTRTMQGRTTGSRRSTFARRTTLAAVVGLTLATAQTAAAQQAIGVPFIGRNHLSVSATELSRDGIGQERTSVFGMVYGRRLGGADGRVQYSAIVRTAFRALDQDEDGIVDAGLTLAATRNVVGGLSITGSAGVSAIVWGQQAESGEAERGRVVARTPITAGAAYDFRLGEVTIAPFFSLSGGYSSERDYVNDQRVNLHTGWRFSNSSGVSVRLSEMVLTLTEIARERGLPNNRRMLFTAGMSW